LASLLAAAVVGCAQKTRVETVETPVAPVSHPAQREVTDYVDFTGRTEAVQSVNIIARVTGYVTQIPFKEGSEVKAGDLLFKIDPRPYEAQYDQASSQVELAEAQRGLAKTTLDRYEALAKTNPGAVSEQALDQYKAAVVEADARVLASKKSLEVYKLNLDFCSVKSPIDGQVSRYYLTLGNLVNQDQTLLTTVVSLDPIYVYFDMDEATRLRILDLIEKGNIAPPAEGDMQIRLGLQNEEGFPHSATVDFTNNQINSTTGSITMRGRLLNPPLIPGSNASKQESKAPAPKSPSADQATTPKKSPASGKASLVNIATTAASRIPSAGKTPTPATAGQSVLRRFTPGMFVRVEVPIGQPRKALLVIDRAIQSDQGHKFVYVVDEKNIAHMRRIETGSLQEDGLRVVEDGLKPDDLVVVGSIQQVRDKMEIKPDARLMPTLAGQSEAAPAMTAAANGSGKK